MEGEAHQGRPLVPSDALVSVRAFFEAFPQLAVYGRLFQLQVVVDANVILGDLIWLTSTRRDPGARTSLQEVLAASTVVAAAPWHLDVEVTAKIKRVSRELGIDLATLESEWEVYRSKIEFHPDPPIAQELVSSARDPDDLAYLLLSQDLGRVIYSHDDDLNAMGGAVIDLTVIASLRDYSRHAAVEFTFLLGSIIITGITLAVLGSAWSVLSSGLAGFSRLPEWAKWLVVGLVVAALLHPRSREFISCRLRDVAEEAAANFNVLLERTAPLVAAVPEAREGAAAALDQALRGIPTVASA